MKIQGRLLLCTAVLALISGVLGARTLDAVERTSDRLKDRVTPIEEVHRGEHVLLTGTVTRLRDSDEFVLEENTGRIQVYIGWKNRMPVSKGDAVKVWGVADDDGFFGMRPEIYAYAIGLPSGEVIHLSRGDY